MPSPPPHGPPLGEQGPSGSERSRLRPRSRSSSRRASPTTARASSAGTHNAQPVASTSSLSGATSPESQRTPARQLRFNPVVSSSAHQAAGASSFSAVGSTSFQIRPAPRMTAAGHETIDLTGDSPPVVSASSSRTAPPYRPTSRHPTLTLPGSDGHRSREAAAQDGTNAIASGSGSGSGSASGSGSGAETRARRGTRAGVGQPSLTIELSSSSSSDDDDHDDDDIQVIEHVGAASGARRRITRANDGGGNTTRTYENGYLRPPQRNTNGSTGNIDNDTSGDAALARAWGAAEDQGELVRHGPVRHLANNTGDGSMFHGFMHGNGGGARNGGGGGGGGGHPLGTEDAGHPFARIFALYPGLLANFGYIDYGLGAGFNIGGLARGLAGVMPANGGGWGGQDRVRAGKKYAIKMSHPRKVELGFTRDIVEPIDPNAPPSPATTSKKGGSKGGRGKAKDVQVVETEPVCASCLEPLLLAQSGDNRPWALRCGHCVCGKCVSEARSRAKLARMGHWTEVDLRTESINGSDRDGGCQRSGNDEDDDLEYIDFGSSTTTANGGIKRKASSTTSAASAATSATKKRKGKQKSVSEQTRIEDEWTSCPVVGCMGERTNVLAPEGDITGPFELYV